MNTKLVVLFLALCANIHSSSGSSSGSGGRGAAAEAVRPEVMNETITLTVGLAGRTITIIIPAGTDPETRTRLIQEAVGTALDVEPRDVHVINKRKGESEPDARRRSLRGHSRLIASQVFINPAIQDGNQLESSGFAIAISNQLEQIYINATDIHFGTVGNVRVAYINHGPFVFTMAISPETEAHIRESGNVQLANLLTKFGSQYTVHFGTPDSPSLGWLMMGVTDQFLIEIWNFISDHAHATAEDLRAFTTDVLGLIY